MLVDKHLNLSYYVKLLPLILEVVDPRTLCLLEYNELLTLHVYYSLMAKV